jgi:hypothetical protein
MLLTKQFVDSIYGLLLAGGKDEYTKKEWEGFKGNINECGILNWNVEDQSLSVNVLDYQKLINLYQHICSNSAHPLWI